MAEAQYRIAVGVITDPAPIGGAAARVRPERRPGDDAAAARRADPGARRALADAMARARRRRCSTPGTALLAALSAFYRRARAAAAGAGRAPAQGDGRRLHLSAVRRLHARDAADPRLDADGDPRARLQPEGAAEHAAARVLPPPRQRAALDAAELPHARLLLAHRPPLSPVAGDAAGGASAAALGEARRRCGRSTGTACAVSWAQRRLLQREGFARRASPWSCFVLRRVRGGGDARGACASRPPRWNERRRSGGEAERTPIVASNQSPSQLRAARESSPRPSFWKLPPYALTLRFVATPIPSVLARADRSGARAGRAAVGAANVPRSAPNVKGAAPRAWQPFVRYPGTAGNPLQGGIHVRGHV